MILNFHGHNFGSEIVKNEKPVLSLVKTSFINSKSRRVS
jgi:hypothetical protein